MNFYNLHAEQSILGSILLDPNSMFEGNEINFSANDFYYPTHNIIYSAMKKLSNCYVEIDMVTLSNELKNIDKLNEIGGVAYLTSLVTIVPTSDNIIYYMKIVKELALKRTLFNMLKETEKSILNLDKDELVKFSEDWKDVIFNSGNVEDLYIDASTISRTLEFDGAIQTGFNYIDALFSGGLNFGSLTILTGEPGSGKSTILNQLIANSLTTGNSSFIYSGELTYQMLMSWFTKTVANEEDLIKCQDRFGINFKVSDDCWNMICDWVKDKFFIYSKDARADERNLTSVIEYLATKKSTKLFVLDNLMTLDCYKGYEKYEQQITMVKSLKNLAKKHSIAIILVAHPNKSSKTYSESHIFEIAGASEIGNLADYILKTVRDDDKEITRLLVLKNRLTGFQRKNLILKFDPVRKRFFSSGERELIKDYGYKPKPEQFKLF